MDERAVLQALRSYRLERRLRRAQGALGAELGNRAGSSLEFHDYRAYQPGDDPRRIDWAVYGRSEELTVRLFREEIHPRLDIVLDGSRSMALADGRKPALALELCAFAWHSARLQGSAVRVHVAGERLHSSEQPPSAAPRDGRSLLFDAPGSCARALRGGGLRIVISDFMTESSVHAAIRELSAGAAQLVVLRTLGPWEASPDIAGALELLDVETGDQLAAQLAAQSVARYRSRLARLSESLRASCRATGARFADVICDVPLLDALRRDLLPAGVVAPS
ncbi:MAG TPA: DUF58 domain-containing protein [Polyangiales bacterium]|nr:DUF58 domain-containing protein [Polyangiales bacterium]